MTHSKLETTFSPSTCSVPACLGQNPTTSVCDDSSYLILCRQLNNIGLEKPLRSDLFLARCVVTAPWRQPPAQQTLFQLHFAAPSTHLVMGYPQGSWKHGPARPSGCSCSCCPFFGSLAGCASSTSGDSGSDSDSSSRSGSDSSRSRSSRSNSSGSNSSGSNKVRFLVGGGGQK